MAEITTVAKWRLKKGEDRRIREGHPWVFSNELQGSPKGIEPGAPIEILDAGGAFIGWGYGNPSSLIAGRVLSRNFEDNPWVDIEKFLTKRLIIALNLREDGPLKGRSYRWVFGEADGLPGLVIDRFVLGEQQAERIVVVIQPHTAGADRWVGILEKAIPNLLSETLGLKLPCSVVVRRDMAVRLKEGLSLPADQALPLNAGLDSILKNAKIRVAQAIHPQETLVLGCDLLEGQKTGFFLDQWANIRGVLSSFEGRVEPKVRILDLFSYVGQWGAQLALALKAQGKQVEVVCVDASAQALEYARTNLEALGIAVKTVKADIFELPYTADVLGGDKSGLVQFDWVVLDPPALIKAKKDHPQGMKAYQQLNTKALSVVKPGGVFVSCSCSALLSDEEFQRLIGKAVQRSGKEIRFIGRGSPSPDHPWQAGFSEGRYLKAVWGKNC